MAKEARKWLTQLVHKAQVCIKSFCNNQEKDKKLITVPAGSLTLLYENGILIEVLTEGSYLRDEKTQKITLVMDGKLELDVANAIRQVCPAMTMKFDLYKIMPNHYLLAEQQDIPVQIIKDNGSGKIAWWRGKNSMTFKEFDCEHPEVFWAQAHSDEKIFLKKNNIISSATIQPDETDVLLHYYKNELLEVIHTPGTYVFCNHQGQHILFPIKSWQTCLISQASHPKLKEFTKTLQLNHNQILIVKKNIDGTVKLFENAGKYYFWNLPGDDMSFDIIDCNQLIVPQSDMDKLESSIKTVKQKLETMPSHWDEYQWRYLISDKKIIKQFTPEENIVWLWKNQAEIQGAYFRMIPHRQQKLKLAGQTVYTKDKASVKVSCVIPYSIPDAEQFIQKSPEIFYQLGYHGSITGMLEMEMHLTFQMVLRDIIQNYTTEELIENRKEIQTAIYNEIKTFEDQYGLTIQSVHLRDIILSKELQDMFNQVMVAEKKAQIKTIERKDEVAANRSLINTAKLLQEHPGAFALRKLQTVEAICEKIQTLNLNLAEADNPK